MDLEIIILSEVSQREKDKNHMIYHLHVESKKIIETYLQDRNRLTDKENKLMFNKGASTGEGERRDKLGIWD